jgi:transposase
MYRRRGGAPPALFLYDVTSSYLEGQHNALGDYGYPRDSLPAERGKRGKLQIVKEQFGVAELVFVGDRGMVKSKGKQALEEAGLRYISALTDPQIRRLLKEGTLQLGLFHEAVCEVEVDGVRYLLRKNEAEAAREQHRLEDKLAKLARKVEQRNEQVKASPRCQPQAGPRNLQVWVARHKLTGQVELRLEGRIVVLQRNQAAIDRAMELAGCYVERDFRQIKTGLLEVPPVFARKESRTRGHVFGCMLALKIGREVERRLQAAFGTTDGDPHAITVEDAMAALSRLCLQNYEIDESTTATRFPRPDARQQQILNALGVSLPQGKM